MNGAADGPMGPTVILIGGRMTVDDGSSLDSRQPVWGDPESQITNASLATSLLWWTTVSSLVDLLLNTYGRDAFALLIGGRSVVDLRQDGTLRRTHLRSLLSGGTTTVELVRTPRHEPLRAGFEEATKLRNWNQETLGSVGFKLGADGQRWRFLNGNEYYLRDAGAAIRAAVVVCTSQSLTSGDAAFLAARYKAFEQGLLYDDRALVVMPHTHSRETFLRGYLAWVKDGRPIQSKSSVATSTWDPTAPPNPIRYMCPVPIQAEFGVTGLAQDGDWRDTSDLEAARKLLQTRFDLKIGIWDLARNATLRRTLLAGTPANRTPIGVVKTPSGATQRATRRVAEKLEKAEVETAAQIAIAWRLERLRALGWTADARLGAFRLALTKDLSRWPDDPRPGPVLSLTLQISKRRSSVNVYTPMYNQVNLGKYVRARQAVFERIAAPEHCDLVAKPWPVLWWSRGGWADDIDWEQRGIGLAQRTETWVEQFTSLRDECLRILQGRFDPLLGSLALAATTC